MKGVSKRVVEITETGSEAIERVLVFLRPECGQMQVEQCQAEAEKYVANLVCYRRRFFASSGKAVRIVGIGLAVLVVLAIFVYFI